MQRHNTQTIRDELSHGHSDLIRVLDEVDAHLRGLLAEPDAPDVILNEFIHYAYRLHDEVVEHIAEEERELFPMVRTIAGSSELDELGRLQQQHRDLVGGIDQFLAALEVLPSKPPDALCAGLATLSRQASILREELVAHSREERAFLRTIEERLAVTCLRG